MQIHKVADRKLATTLHRKPTDCAALLHFHFNHSVKSKESIVFSQALRYSLLIADHTIQKKKELDYLKYLSLPKNALWKSSLAKFPKLSSTLVTSLATESPGHQVPELSFQLWPHADRKKNNSPSQYETIGFLLKKTHNCTASGSPPPTPSIPPSHSTIKQNPSRTS